MKKNIQSFWIATLAVVMIFSVVLLGCGGSSPSDEETVNAISAALDADVTLDGEKDTAVPEEDEVVLTINLTNAMVKGDLKSKDVSSWFFPKAGLTYTTAADTAEGASVIKVTVSGTPNEFSDDVAEIKIPKASLWDIEGKVATADVTVSGSFKLNIETEEPVAELSVRSVTIAAMTDNDDSAGAVPADTTIILNLVNQTTVNTALTNANATSWFNTPVAGLTATANAAAGASAITIKVAGEPTAESTDTTTITIPVNTVKKGNTAYANSFPVTGGGEVKYAITKAPAGAADHVTASFTGKTVEGTVNAAITPVDIAVTIADGKLAVALAEDADLSAYIPSGNRVAGLTYTATADAAVGNASFSITIAGTPTAASSGTAQIVIPKAALEDDNGDAPAADVTATGTITYDIAADD